MSNCSKCFGTGKDLKLTLSASLTGTCYGKSYIRCNHCHGNGLEPVYPSEFREQYWALRDKRIKHE